ncbi:MAG: PKD domain-containing protein [Bacteroidaceae bacterium]|nr:PKD domain-containing protein [Bacteroidaceae bacterium]
MKRITPTLLFVTFLVLAYGSSLSAQEVDTTLYRDYNPNAYTHLAPYAARRARAKEQMRRGAPARTLPDHVNNAETKYFPPIINQDGGSCGSAQNIGYMLTYELNCYRNTDASLPENQLPTHFTWLLTGHNSDKEVMARTNGVPNVTTYGGRTYSKLFGNQTCDDDDFGWMQGYDKWYSAMWNRSAGSFSMTAPTNTPEGRQELKEWLYDHCGDTSLPAGGIAGIGVAAYGTWATIPSTPANKKIGVAGMKYVKSWGDTYNHALTICGYDDRIEFDLDGDGIYGEEDNDEVGAWIIANSWGDGWENKGFIYCPYKLCYAVGTNNGAWTPGAHIARRDYRPLRTFKIKMDYSRRSELSLSGGISENIDATEPDAIIPFEHFKNAGNHSNVNPAPEVPMLGRWVDGMHYEPMEFGYDLTDLTSTVDRTKPLKYFFVIQTKGTAIGTGNIYECSLINYEMDDNGIEIPFDIEGPVAIRNKGKRTIISVVVPGEQIYRPQNLTFADGTLTWEKPQPSTLPLVGYRIYEGGELIDSVPAAQRSYKPSVIGTVAYTVAAVYRYGGYTHVSDKSNAAACYTPSEGDNHILNFSNSGMTIPNAMTEALNQATIEFWMKPTTVRSYNQQIGPGWGTFLFHTDSSGRLVVGWNTGSEERMQLSGIFKAGTWAHVAVTINKNVMTAFVNGVRKGQIECPTYSGLAAFGNLVFGHGSDNYWNGSIDEFRIWKTVRTLDEIKNNMSSEIAFPASQEDLIVYLRMDTIHRDDEVLIEELVSGKHATLYTNGSWQTGTNNTLLTGAPAFSASIKAPAATAYAGMPVVLKASTPVTAVKWQWEAEGASTPVLTGLKPSFVFNEAGDYSVTLTATAADGTTAQDTKTITVVEPSKPSADFRIAADTLPAGDRFSFINVSEGVGCTYEWYMPVAEVEHVFATNASALYPTLGTFPVTLTVTNAQGSSSMTREVTVTASAPKALFAVSAPNILLGDSVTLTDESRYEPTDWKWELSNGHRGFLVSGQNVTVIPIAPGLYDIKLTTGNEHGSDVATQNKALIVSNADSYTGLRFGGGGDHMTVSAPLALQTDALTFDWWMRPSSAADMQFFADANGYIAVSFSADGTLRFRLAGKEVSSDASFVVPGEWHHYAVVYDKGTVRFYRDALLVSTPSTKLVTAAELNTTGLVFSNATGGFNGIVDELHLWTTALAAETLGYYANAPICDIATAELRHGLLLYYDFNQNGGDVIDRSSHALNAVRRNFGPDGDAWNSSLGVFTLDLAVGPAGDITNQYLTNYQRPYYTASGTVNPTNSSRFRKLEMGTQRSGWKDANAIVNGSINTGAHVDTAHGNDITIETIWSNFADELLDYRLWQTVSLPAGKYTFSCTLSDGTSTQTSRILANYGPTLLGEDDCESGAIAWAMLSECTVSFTLAQAAEVSLGVIVNMREQSCLSFKEFKLEGLPLETIEAADDTKGDAWYLCLWRPDIAVTQMEKTLYAHPSGVRSLPFLAWHDFDAADPTQLWTKEEAPAGSGLMGIFTNIASGLRVAVHDDGTVSPADNLGDSYVYPALAIAESGEALLASDENVTYAPGTVTPRAAKGTDVNTARVKQALTDAGTTLKKCYDAGDLLVGKPSFVTPDDADPYVLIDFGDKPSDAFIVTTITRSATRRPSKITLQGSNDTSVWTTLGIFDVLPNALPFNAIYGDYNIDLWTGEWTTGLVHPQALYRYVRLEVNNINYNSAEGEEGLVNGHHRFSLDSVAVCAAVRKPDLDAAIVDEFVALVDDVNRRFRAGVAGDYDIQRLTDATHVFASYSSPAYASLAACVRTFTSDGNDYYSSMFDRTTADAYLAVLIDAQSALVNRSSTDEEYEALETALRAAYDAIVIRRDLDDGLYYIDNGFDMLFTKGMYAFGDNLVAWNNADRANPAFLWEVKYLETVHKGCRYLIRNYATGTYLHHADDSYAYLTPQSDAAQYVYLLDDDNYAIRSELNALDYAPDFFADGCGTGGRLIAATPDNQPHAPASWRFVPATDDDLQAIRQAQDEEARREALGTTFPFTADYPLITDAAQISTNLLGGRITDLAKLIDGKPSTRYKSNSAASDASEVLAGKRPYLQIDLLGTTRYVYITTDAYSPSNTSLRPMTIRVSRSADGNEWTDVATLRNIPNAYPQDGGYIAETVTTWQSPVVDLGEGTRHVRLWIDDVNYRSHAGNDNNLYTDFGLSELQLYDADGANSIRRIEADRPGAVYDLFGRRVIRPQKGTIYILDGKKTVF